jgi:hypothetical protein
MPTFQELYDNCAFQAFERQMRAYSLFGDQQWLLDTELATIAFNNGLTFPVQFLGTHSEVSDSWLWADANSATSLPTRSLDFCRNVRANGRKFGIEEFGMDKFPIVYEVGRPNADTLVMVATSIGTASCYYRAPHENGAVYVAICDPRIDNQPDLDREGFIEGFNNLMWQAGNMKMQIISYLSEKGYIGKDFNGSDLKCSLYTGEEICLQFKSTTGGGMSITFSGERTFRT